MNEINYQIDYIKKESKAVQKELDKIRNSSDPEIDYEHTRQILREMIKKLKFKTRYKDYIKKIESVLEKYNGFIELDKDSKIKILYKLKEFNRKRTKLYFYYSRILSNIEIKGKAPKFLKLNF